MKRKPIRVGVTLDIITAGRLDKSGENFLEDHNDVTSDVLQAIINYVGVGNEIRVHVNKKPKYAIAVREINDQDLDELIKEAMAIGKFDKIKEQALKDYKEGKCLTELPKDKEHEV